MDVAKHLLMLGVEASTPKSDLRSAYLREIKKWHPDRFFNDPDGLANAHERSIEINTAYEFLTELYESGRLPITTSASGRETREPRWEQYEGYEVKHTYNGKRYTPGFPDADVFEVFVKSSHIVSVGYNRKTQTLFIKFDGDAIYSYAGVPESVFADFMSAESHGKFAHRHIYYNYPYRRH